MRLDRKIEKQKHTLSPSESVCVSAFVVFSVACACVCVCDGKGGIRFDGTGADCHRKRVSIAGVVGSLWL